MSLNKLGIALFSAFLMFAMAPMSPAQQSTNPDTTKKQTTTQKSTTTTETGKGTTPDQQTTTKTKSKKTTKKSTESTTADTEKKTDETGKATETKKTPKKTSAISSDKVRDTQTALKNEGFNPGPIDGIMGPMTMAAIRNYQSKNNLEVTGTLTPETESALLTGAAASKATGVERAKPSEGTTHPDHSKDMSREKGYATTPESLGLSTKGTVSSVDDVKQVQQHLADLGYNPGDANGLMTAQTQQSVREFQWLNSLPVTGKIDDQTKMAIQSQWSGASYSSGSGPISKSYGSPLSAVAAVLVAQNPYPNQDTTKHKDSTYATGKVEKDGFERATKSAEVLQDLVGTGDKKIPNELLERAEAIAVIPHMIKGAFGIGGRFGKGVVSQRTAGGRWSAPSYLNIGGGSFGAQLGVTATDLVLVFTDRKALSLLEGGKDLKLGVDAGVAAGPIGRSAEAGVNVNLESAIYAYSRSKGLFAGVALDGAVLDINDSMNSKVYGASVDARQILNGQVPVNATVRPFVDALDKVVPPKRLTQK